MINKIVAVLIIGLSLIGCKEKQTEKVEVQEEVELQEKVTFNQELVDKLERMAEVDQIAAYVRQGKYKQMSKEQWNAFKDSVFTTHEKILQQIFDKNGFVGFDLAGEQGSYNFWLMVQHCDHNPEFQTAVLEKMKIEVDKQNASPTNYAYLVDRVNINSGKDQVYGTQFDYNKLGQAYPKNISDTTGIDERRKSVGLIPMVERMNEMTISHFMMNKEYFKEKGITEPNLYTIQ